MKWWVLVQKQEMTRIWLGDTQVPVTLVKLIDQEVVRHKTSERDGYDAVVVWVDKTTHDKEKGQKITYRLQCEFRVSPEVAKQLPAGEKLHASLLQDVERVDVVAVSKGKGFQGVMKRHNFRGWPATHGSKFHRAGGSTGNRKPRRTHKNHPMAWQMGGDQITLKRVAVVDRLEIDGTHLLALKGSLPGAYNGLIRLYIA